MSRRLAVLSLILLFAAPASQAQSNPSPTPYADEIVVTASAVEEPLATVPASVSVITREEIDARGARAVGDLLREIPGLYVSRTGSPGKAVSLFMRGGNSTHTVVMWNGVKMNSPYFAGYEIGTFSTAGVEKIEVVRGPFSSLYGSDAMAGVVNILGAPDRTGLDASLQAGGNGLFNGLVGGGWTSAGLRFDGTVEARRDDGFAPNDDFEQTTLSASVFRTFGSVDAGARVRYNAWDLGVPFNTSADGSALVPSLRRRQDGEELQVHLPFRQEIGAFSWDLTLSRYDRDDRFEDPEDPFGFAASDTESTTDRARLVARYRTRGAGTIVAGVELERAEVDDVSSYGVNLLDQTRKATSFFVEDRFGAQVGTWRLEVAAGLRYDDFDTFGSELSPRLAGALIRDGHKLRAAYGEGFRAPSIGELYFPFFGNDGLDPERSRSVEAGWDYTRGPVTTSVTLFHNDFDNLIVYDNAAFRFENAGAAETRGVELGARAVLGAGVSGGISYTWLDTEQAATGEALLRRPEHSGSVHVGFQRGAFDSLLVVTHGGTRSDVRPVFPYDTLPNGAWTTADLTLRYRFGAFEPWAGVENLLDEEHEEVLGYPSPGRRALLGVRYSLK